MSDYLIHYGVKGMKWGVRRYQNPDGSLTKQGRARNKGLRTKQKLVKQYLNKDMTKRQLDFDNRSDDTDLLLDKGSKVTHVTPLDFKQLRKGQDLYVSGTDFDKNMYRTFLTLKMQSKGFKTPIKEVEFTLNKQLKAPSDSNQRKMFNDIFDKSKEQVTKDLNTYYKNNKKYDNADAAYDDFIKALDKPSSSKTEFYNKLRENNYNAVLDTHDITDTWMQAKKPLIVMDAMDTLSDLKVSELTNDRLIQALDELIKA